MVTIVKPQESKQVKCRKCGSVLEYVFTEIQERKTVDYDGSRDVWRVVMCGGMLFVPAVGMKLVYEKTNRVFVLCYNELLH